MRHDIILIPTWDEIVAREFVDASLRIYITPTIICGMRHVGPFWKCVQMNE
jgi:hypothetical protein